jgi:hypothetical protein
MQTRKQPEPSKSHVKRCSYDFASRRLAQVALLDGEAPTGMPGLTLSRDQRALLYTQLDSTGIDLMLVQNFR